MVTIAVPETDPIQTTPSKTKDDQQALYRSVVDYEAEIGVEHDERQRGRDRAVTRSPNLRRRRARDEDRGRSRQWRRRDTTPAKNCDQGEVTSLHG